MRTIKELWLSPNKKYRIVRATYADNSIDIQVELLGPWPKIGVPAWQALSGHEIHQLPKYIKQRYEQFIVAADNG
jgi:hypothetical protein